MKAILRLISLVGASIPVLGIAADQDTPQHQAEVICYLGKLGSGSSCATKASEPGSAPPKTNTMTCGFTGKVSEIKWTYVGRKNGKDVYDFSRRFPMKTEKAATQSKTVQFDGTRIIIFEDAEQVIVIQSPKS